MAIDLVRMPPEIGRGFVRAMGFGTDVVRLDGGMSEERVRTLEMPALQWQASKGIFSAARLDEFAGFIRARGGALHGFRFCDLGDCSTNPTDQSGAPSMLDQLIGVGDGVTTEFELRRTYPSTTNDLPQREAVEDRFLPIVNEVDDRLARCLGLANGTTFNPSFAVDAVVNTDWTVNLRRRTVIFDTAPAVGEFVTGGWYYDWLVRLGEDADANFEEIREAWKAGTVPNIPLVGIPFDRFTPETDDPGGCKALAWSSGRPVLNKGEAKVWELTPGAGSLSVALQEPSDVNYGGEHFLLLNRSGSQSVLVVDEITGTTICTLAAQPTSTSGALIFLRGTSTTRAWFSVAVFA